MCLDAKVSFCAYLTPTYLVAIRHEFRLKFRVRQSLLSKKVLPNLQSKFMPKWNQIGPFIKSRSSPDGYRCFFQIKF